MLWNEAAGKSDACRRVLVVDDHADTAEVLTIMFNCLGYEARYTQRGRDALDAARAFDPQLILLDLGLPDLSGYEVVRAMRADPRTASRVIVAVSGWGRPGDVLKALKSGFDEHVLKPLDLAKVREILRLASDRAGGRELAATAPRACSVAADA